MLFSKLTFLQEMLVLYISKQCNRDYYDNFVLKIKAQTEVYATNLNNG